MLDRVGNCKIEAELASGGMAVIYRAEQESLGRKVAIKALKTAVMADPHFAEHFFREAQTLAQLQHENLIHVYDFYAERGALFIVMELVDGIDLYDLMVKQPVLPASVAAVIALQVARALSYLHFCGVLHRDIKPANILVTKSGVVKLGDFGIATDSRLLGVGVGSATAESSTDELAASGIGLGTPGYMSPEQVVGEPLDFRSDQFALGIVLYQMLGGRKPFVAEAGDGPDSARVVLQKIRTEQPPSLRKLSPQVPLELCRIVDRCLQKSPQQRYRSPQELVQALESFLTPRVTVDYHALLLLFLQEQGVLTTQEAQAALGPELYAQSSGLTAPIAALMTLKTVTSRWWPFSLGGPRRRLWWLLAGGGLATVLGLWWLLGKPVEPVLRAGDPSTAGVAAGELLVVVDPWAEVYIDGHLYETTPFAQPLRLRTGSHEVELRHPQFASVQKKVEIAAQQKVVLRVQLSAPLGGSDENVPGARP